MTCSWASRRAPHRGWCARRVPGHGSDGRSSVIPDDVQADLAAVALHRMEPRDSANSDAAARAPPAAQHPGVRCRPGLIRPP